MIKHIQITNLLRINGPWIRQCTGRNFHFGALFSGVTPWGTHYTISRIVLGFVFVSWSRHGRAQIFVCTQSSTRSCREETTRSSHAHQPLSFREWNDRHTRRICDLVSDQRERSWGRTCGCRQFIQGMDQSHKVLLLSWFKTDRELWQLPYRWGQKGKVALKIIYSSCVISKILGRHVAIACLGITCKIFIAYEFGPWMTRIA